MTLLVVLPLILTILLGFGVHRLNILPVETTQVLNKFLVTISFPIVIFLGIANSDFSKLSTYLPFLVVSLFLVSGVYLIVFFLTRLLKLNYAKSGAIVLAAVTGNVAFIGFPVIKGFFGDNYLEFAYIYILVFSLALTIVGLTLVQIRHESIKVDYIELIRRAFVNPLTIAALLGLLALVAQIRLPDLILSTMSSIAQVTTPLALFSIGGFISANFKLQELKLTLLAVTIKLVLMPISMLVILNPYYSANEAALVVSVMQAAMPTSLTELAIAHEYKLDTKITASTILLTTVLSPLSLLLWATVLQS